MATDYVALYRSLLKRPSISERETIVPTDQVGMNNAARLRETNYVAGHVRFELRNVVANYSFEKSRRFAAI
jgi:hypothetical protein